MFGEIAAWFYKALAGINLDSASLGFKHFIIRPQPVGDLTFARAEYDSIRGKILSDWKRKNGQFQLQVLIPANTTASVHVPATMDSNVTESGKPASNNIHIKFLRMERRCAVYELESGDYHFVSN